MSSAARPAHAGVGGGDDRHLGAVDVGLEGAGNRLGHVPRVDVAPQVPLPDPRVVLPGLEPGVVRRLHDVRDPEPDERDAGPPGELVGHRLADELRERVGRLRPGRVGLVDRGVGRRVVEWQPEDRLARGPDDPADAAVGGRREHVVRRERVVPERLAGRLDLRRRDRREVDDGVGAGDDLVALAQVGEVGQDRLARGRHRRGDVDVQDVVAGRPQVPDDPATGLAAPAR
jgi:hypothetical protein